MLQVRKAEERRDRRAGSCHMHGAVAHLDFLLGLVEILGVWISRQIPVRPGVGADRHAGVDHLFGDFRMPGRVLADFEECGLQAFVGQRLEDGGRVRRPRAVVERQNDLFVAEEVVLLEVLEAEAGTAGGVDLDDAGETHAAGFIAWRNIGGGRRGLGLCGRRWRVPLAG